MYVGKNYTAARTELLSATFTCEACQYSSEAEVLGLGHGGAASPYFLDGEGAQRHAANQALRNARKEVEVIFSLAPCPECRRRKPAAVHAFPVKAAIAVVGVLAISGVVGQLVRLVVRHRSHNDATGTFVGIGVAFLSAMLGLTLESAKRRATWAGSLNESDSASQSGSEGAERLRQRRQRTDAEAIHS